MVIMNREHALLKINLGSITFYIYKEWVAQRGLMHEIMKSRKIRKIGNKCFLFTGIRDKEHSHDRAECILKQSHVKRIVMYTDPPIHDY